MSAPAKVNVDEATREALSGLALGDLDTLGRCLGTAGVLPGGHRAGTPLLRAGQACGPGWARLLRLAGIQRAGSRGDRRRP